MEQQRAELDQKLLLICEDIEQCLKQAFSDEYQKALQQG